MRTIRYVAIDPKHTTRLDLGAHFTERQAWAAARRYAGRSREALERRGWTVWARALHVGPPSTVRITDDPPHTQEMTR